MLTLSLTLKRKMMWCRLPIPVKARQSSKYWQLGSCLSSLPMLELATSTGNFTSSKDMGQFLYSNYWLSSLYQCITLKIWPVVGGPQSISRWWLTLATRFFSSLFHIDLYNHIYATFCSAQFSLVFLCVWSHVKSYKYPESRCQIWCQSWDHLSKSQLDQAYPLGS